MLLNGCLIYVDFANICPFLFVTLFVVIDGKKERCNCRLVDIKNIFKMLSNRIFEILKKL